MAKRELYDISDEEFAYFLNEIGKSLSKENNQYIFVGGTAVQIHTMKRLCEINKTDISTLSKEKRLQDYLRATDDVDMALSSEIYAGKNELEYAHIINKVLSSLEKEVISPSEDHILEYRIIRKGVKRPVFQISVDGEISDEQIIALNINRKPEDLRNLESHLYQTFVSEGNNIVVPYNKNFSLDVRVISPTNLLATKVSKLRPKDTMDIQNLTQLMTENKENIDINKIQGILGAGYSNNFSRFLSLINYPD